MSSILAATLLLLDKATTALDNESEKIVQASLDNLLVKQKQVHRRSKIRTAGKVAIVSKGVVLEEGTHEELLG